MKKIERMAQGIEICGSAALMAAALVGCAMFGANAKPPTKAEQAVFSTIEVPMVTKRDMTNVVQTTNVVQMTNFVPVPLYLTNYNSILETVYATNEVVSYRTNIAYATNVIAAGSTVDVPQFNGLKPGAQAAQDMATGVANIWGLGGIAGLALSLVGNWWQKSRNAAIAASLTGATSQSNALTQTGIALSQQIETMLELMNKTPQGTQLVPMVKKFLADHQAATNTAQLVAGFIAQNVDNEAARTAASDILSAVKQVQSGTVAA